MYLKNLLYIFILCCLSTSIALGQQERILDFDVSIEVNEDRSINVVEKIKVFANRQNINRGITRSLPLYRDMEGKSVKLKYRIKEVRRDGQKEDYFTEQIGSMLIMYIGNADVYLNPGQYEYEIKYKVPNQIGMFEDYDEIYWNAIGTDVIFPVENARCTVSIPEGASIIQETAYVGQFGSQEKAYERRDDYNKITYTVSRALNPNEGLTIGIGFQKGFIKEPGLLERFAISLIVILGTIILIPYYIITWIRHGIDPQKPTPYPLFSSPQDLSAASLNYIKYERYGNKSLTASIIHLATKGYLRIEEHDKTGFLKFGNEYHLIKEKNADDQVPEEEKEVFNALFSGRETIIIDGKYNSHVENAYTHHKSSLKFDHGSFLGQGANLKFLVKPILLIMAVDVVAAILLFRSPISENLNGIVFGSFIPFGIISLLVYAYLINKPTPEKLKLQSEIEGFKMYLEMAEKERLNLLNPPERTPELFEAMLPFAFALGVEHNWTKNFKSILEDMQYQPQWCNRQPIYFVGHFGTGFSRQVMGSATKPSSDGSGGGFGGSGGGGFSGGGGGGGGVGGW